MARNQMKKFRPMCELLEARELLAAELTASLAAGVLRIDGTDLSDNILVEQVDDRYSVRGISIVTDTGEVSTVDASLVSNR